MRLSPKEDLQEWLTDNFGVIEGSIYEECIKWSEKHNIQKCKTFEKQGELDVVDIENLADSIVATLKTGLMNVIETYKES